MGHKRSGLGDPLTVTGTVKVISDGTYLLEGPGYNGMMGEMGLTVVLAIGSIRLNLRSIAHFEWDLGIHKSVGLSPESAALVFVRSPAHFRCSYTPIAARISGVMPGCALKVMILWLAPAPSTYSRTVALAPAHHMPL